MAGGNHWAEVKRKSMEELRKFHTDYIEKHDEEWIINEWVCRTGYRQVKVKEHLSELRRAGRIKCWKCKNPAAECECIGCGCH